MRVFISADIEGIATTTLFSDGNTQNSPIGQKHAEQMTKEVVAACEGAILAGATFILVRDAHGPAVNIDPHGLPKEAGLIRGWNGDPLSMVYGIDDSFDAALFIGYHAAAGREGSPMAHTLTTSTVYVKLNGKKLSEFELYSRACALKGVPTVFLSGDGTLINDVTGLHPGLVTVTVKNGFGGVTSSIHPEIACERIREGVEVALKQSLESRPLCDMPDNYELEICYRDHNMATKMSFFPGFKKKDDNTILVTTDDYYEILRAMVFVV